MAIYQRHIDRATAATFANDFEGFSACIAYSWRITTNNMTLVIADAHEYRPVFTEFVHALKAEGNVELHRIVQTAWFVSPDVIEGTHISHRLNKGQRVMDPCENRIRLVRDDTHGWRESECANAIWNKAEKFEMVSPAAAHTPPPPLTEYSERTDT